MLKASSIKIKIVPENLVYFHMKIITLVFCALTGTFKQEVLGAVLGGNLLKYK